MMKISELIVKNKKLLVIISLLLIIPSIIGYIKTKTNYDILYYLPSDIETLKGQRILKDDFNMGGFSITLVNENIDPNKLNKLEEKIRDIDVVTNVVSINDLTGTNIPESILPSNLLNKLESKDYKLLLITFSTGTSDEETISAIQSIQSMSKDIKVGGMSQMSLDMRKLVESQMLLYVVVAALSCLFVLMIVLDSYLIPLILLLNIGVSILFNMGTNIFLGNISYITKAIAAVLQLGVTTDFSIFLYHKYNYYKKKEKNNEKAMEKAIGETMVSVIGSSLTTIAGFLALCSMKFELGTDIGIVMAKGVVFGVITVLTFYPSLILIFDKWINKTKHKPIIPKFNHINNFVLKYHKMIFIIFLILLIPAYLSQKNTKVYYKLDSSIPSNYNYSIVSKKLKNDFNLISQSIILVDKKTDNNKLNNMIDELNNIDGIDSIISTNYFNRYGISNEIIPSKINNMLETDKYKLLLINSNYEIATDELNNQISSINKVIDKYDKKAILAGEGALMNDLVEITAIDFKNVNYVSIGVIFLIMFFVLRSLSLPFLLILTIEFAIFINMGIPYWKGTSLPFVSSIVIGTIQLGATIDYAILLTTKYLEERKKKKSKEESVKVALSSSVPSIFVSAMCFFAATFAVFSVSKLDMISSLCLLMARGAIISMLVVILVLPTKLLIFDKLITKTTIGFKKGNNMKKKYKLNKKLLIILLLLLSFNVNAKTKDETVYAKLKDNGELDKVTISEHLYDYDNNKVIDKSILKDIKGTNDEEYLEENNEIEWTTKSDNLYYTGNYSNNLPIELDVKYYLNNKEYKVDDILGKKGNIKIKLTYKNNNLKEINNNKLYVPYVIISTTILNNDTNKNIKVTNGKIVNNGINTVVLGLSSPGLYESLNYNKLKDLDTVEISYYTDKFELNSIYAVASSNLFDENIDTSNINELYNSINLLQSNMNLLVDGSNKLVNGNNQLNNGIQEINNKLELITNKYKYYRNNQDVLKNEINKIIDKNINLIVPSLEDEIVNETTKVIKKHKSELEESLIYYTKENTKNILKEEIEKTIEELDINNIIENMINNNIINIINNDPDLNNLINKLNGDISNIIIINNNDEIINEISNNYNLSVEDSTKIVEEVQKDSYNKIINNINNSNIIKEDITNYINSLNIKVEESINQDIIKNKIIEVLEKELSDDDIYLDNDIKSYIESIANKIINNTAKDISSRYTEEYTNEVVKNVIDKEFDKNNINSNVNKLLDNYNFSELDNNINKLTDNFNKLSNGSNTINNGMNTLNNGLNRYNKEGINKLNRVVNGNIKSYQNKINELIKLSKESNIDIYTNNTKTNSKIIFMIDSKSIKEQNNTKKEVKKESFFDKVKGLFK